MMSFEWRARAGTPAIAEPARTAAENSLQRIFVDSTFDEAALDMFLSGVFEHFPDALILADGQARVTYLNPAAERMLGVTLKNAPAPALDTMLRLQDGETGEAIRILDPDSRHTAFSGVFHLLMSCGGSLTPVQYSVASTSANGGGPGSGYVVSLRDVSSLQQHIDKLVMQTMHDEHTQLLRRAELIKRLWRLLQERDNGEPQAFMYLDLDNFKSINDTAGHAAGDLAIREIASRLKDVVRGRDTLARLGGDEFGLLLERCPAELARQRATQLHQAVETYVLRWNRETFRLSISIGLAIFKTRNHSLNTILAAADAACYQAKRNGEGAPHIQLVNLD
jgi:diguanylate cyclase (GGDEF)-like protein/PAS domain S-box-containing protein